MILSSSMWNIWNTVWIRCWGNCLHLLGFWNFFVFFQFFPLKLVYFWTKNRKNIYGCFFHSIFATELKFGAKNNVRTKQSTLKTLIFAHYWKSLWLVTFFTSARNRKLAENEPKIDYQLKICFWLIVMIKLCS